MKSIQDVLKVEFPNQYRQMKKEEKKPRFRTAYNFKLDKSDLEPGGGVSVCVPGEAMTIAEIARRFASGITDNIARKPVYEDESRGELGFGDVDETRDPAFDLADVTEIQDDIKSRLSKAKSRKAKEQSDDNDQDKKPSEKSGNVVQDKSEPTKTDLK